MKSSSNVVGDSNDENNFPHKLLLTNTQVSRLRKAFANNSSAYIKLSKTQLHKMGQSVGFLGRLLEPLLKSGLPLMGNVLKPLAKSVLIPLGLTAVTTADAAIHKKMFGSDMRPSDLASRATTLIISNEEMNAIMKIVKSLEESGLLIKSVSETIKNEAKEQKGGFLSMLLGTLGASLFVVSIENLKPKVSYLLGKTIVLSIICSKCKNEDEKIFKEEESIEILKILGLIENV